MALQSFAIKVAILIRSAVVGFGLIAIGFEPNTDPSAGVIEGIRSIMIFSPAVGCIIAAAIFYFGYRIEDTQILRMQDEIVARKAGGSADLRAN